MAEMMSGARDPFREVDPSEVAARVEDDVRQARAELDHLADSQAKIGRRQEMLKKFVEASESFVNTYIPQKESAPAPERGFGPGGF